jgi:transcriptional regulator with XRE-family HTH domain
MLSDAFGELLKNARKQLSLSRDELATRAGVSPRLVAELERSQRPNVSLESALKLLNIVGVSVTVRAPDGLVAEIRGLHAADLERAARAAKRREQWTGQHVSLHEDVSDPQPVRSKAKRLGSVAHVSKQGYLIAGAKSVARPKGSRR